MEVVVVILFNVLGCRLWSKAEEEEDARLTVSRLEWEMQRQWEMGDGRDSGRWQTVGDGRDSGRWQRQWEMAQTVGDGMDSGR